MNKINQPCKIEGRFSWIVNGDDICTVAKAVNVNSDILKAVIIEVEQLKKEIETLKQEV